MRDSFGRGIDYLRLSVTEGCNLHCIYCRDLAKETVPSAKSQPSPKRCIEIVSAAASLGVTKVRITGGEPCVRADLAEIVRGIAAVDGIREVCLTTNGTLIAPMAAALKDAGLSRINLSIDSLDERRYRAITRGGSLADALAGLDAVQDAGFEGTKVNCVLMGGVNDDEADAFAAFARERGVEVRFIELMPIGPAAKLAQRPACRPNGANPSIAPISRPFCSSCNRIRVTADEHAKPCLHSAEELSLEGLYDEELADALRRAILAKPAGHRLAVGASESTRDMSRIGG